MLHHQAQLKEFARERYALLEEHGTDKSLDPQRVQDMEQLDLKHKKYGVDGDGPISKDCTSTARSTAAARSVAPGS